MIDSKMRVVRGDGSAIRSDDLQRGPELLVYMSPSSRTFQSASTEARPDCLSHRCSSQTSTNSGKTMQPRSLPLLRSGLPAFDGIADPLSHLFDTPRGRGIGARDPLPILTRDVDSQFEANHRPGTYQMGAVSTGRRPTTNLSVSPCTNLNQLRGLQHRVD